MWTMRFRVKLNVQFAHYDRALQFNVLSYFDANPLSAVLAVVMTHLSMAGCLTSRAQ